MFSILGVEAEGDAVDVTDVVPGPTAQNWVLE